MAQPKNDSSLLTAVSMLAATVMIAQHIAGKAARDALFLTYFDVSRLPTLMMVSAALSVASVLLMSRLLTRFGPARLIPPLYLLSAGLLAAQWVFSETVPQVSAVALYLHVAALNSILISGFWSVVNERFDPYTAKQIVPKLTAATTFGGVLGGVAASAVAAAANTNAILLMLSAMHLVCGLAVGMLARGRQATDRQATPRDEPAAVHFLAPLKDSPLIRRMAILALLVAITAGVLDYILKAEASASLSSSELITFFSYFYTSVGLGTFLLQSAFGKGALRWLGLGGTMAAWPLAILTTGGLALVVRSLATATMLRGSAMLLYNSFFRSGFELLYTPISPADKRAGKVLIDVGADRAGDLVSGLILTAILALPVASESVLLVAALVLALICLAFLLVIHRGYVTQLATNLRSGALQASELEAIDATTVRTIAVTQTSIERGKLLRDISAYGDSAGAPAAQPQPQAPAPRPSGPRDVVAEAVADLSSGDEARIRRVLTGRKLTAALLPHAIPLLADGRVLEEALRAIRRAATQAPGQLVDALLDPVQHPLVRRRLPLILGHSDSPLAVLGLTMGLDHSDWNVRFRCARGLQTLKRRHPHLEADEDKLLQAIDEELRSLAKPSPDPDAKERRIQYLFQLFAALYDPETLELCEHALESGDRGLQGTALEYLENLLPSEIWTRFRPFVATAVPHTESKRSLQQAARALLASAPHLKAKHPRPDATNTPTEPLD